jgi:hypothetical protein
MSGVAACLDSFSGHSVESAVFPPSTADNIYTESREVVTATAKAKLKYK